VYSIDYSKRVRYGETDQMGYLYHGVYAQYYEIGRVEMLRSLGVTYRDMEEAHGILMPVMSLQMRFVRPALYDQLLTIRTTLRTLPVDTITFYVDIYNEDRKLVSGGSVRLCFIDRETRKTIAVPPYLVDILRPFFHEA
jgi:acyl-CoA thioester hydrolase